MMQGINLIPEEIRRGWKLGSARRRLALAGALYLMFIFTVYGGQRSVITKKETILAGLTKERDEALKRSYGYRGLSERLMDIRRSEEELKKRLNVTAGLGESLISWSNVLKRIARDMPEGVWLRALSTSDTLDGKGKKIRFLGSAVSNRGIADFIFTLENSGYLKDASFSYSQKTEYAGTSVYDFELYMDLKKSGGIMNEW